MASWLRKHRQDPGAAAAILFTLALLAVYRIGVFVTTPGVNRVES